MAMRGWNLNQIEHIKQLLREGLSDRQIAKIVHCRRTLVKSLRGLNEGQVDETLKNIGLAIHVLPPEWSAHVNFTEVVALIKKGFEIKRIWENSAAALTTYSNFWKYLSKNFPELLRGTITLRNFTPGSQCEVDWAGDKIQWYDLNGKNHDAHVFVGILCFSQLVFVYATRDEKQVSFIDAHERFFKFLDGTTAVTVSDNLKTGIRTPDRYDAEINPVYQEFATHYNTAVVPAGVYKPKHKALVEGAVGIVMRYFKWCYRGYRFRSITEINDALKKVTSKINEREHSRFKMSRLSRYLTLEKAHLRPLPVLAFEQIEWKTATVHQDNTVEVDAAYYSVPHILRGKLLRIKLTQNQIEIFSELARVALHARDRNRFGNRVIDTNHMPENSRAYLETTPQNILSQARFISAELHSLIDELFKLDALGHLRRALGLVRYARSEIEKYGRVEAEPRIREAVAHMVRFNQMRTRVFKETIERLRQNHQLSQTKIDREIIRIPGNPMLRKTESVPVQGVMQGILIPFPERK